MALRIVVNDELRPLGDTLRAIINRLKPGGRFAVITFHSIEDRVCKQTFVQLSGRCTCPRHLPVCACGLNKKINIVTPRPIVASEAEVNGNVRARGAKLRIVERIETR